MLLGDVMRKAWYSTSSPPPVIAMRSTALLGDRVGVRAGAGLRVAVDLGAAGGVAERRAARSPSAIVWTPVPGMLKAMPSAPECAFADSIAARSVQTSAAVRQMPSAVFASASSAVELTVNVTFAGASAASCGAHAERRRVHRVDERRCPSLGWSRTIGFVYAAATAWTSATSTQPSRLMSAACGCARTARRRSGASSSGRRRPGRRRSRSRRRRTRSTGRAAATGSGRRRPPASPAVRGRRAALADVDAHDDGRAGRDRPAAACRRRPCGRSGARARPRGPARR